MGDQRCQTHLLSLLRLLHLFSGGIGLILAENFACAAGSTGRCFTTVLAGSFPRKLSPFQFVAGLIGRGTNPPPQLGQTLSRTRSTQVTQNVHSYEQIRASSESGGSDLLQCSQVGLRSSIEVSSHIPVQHVVISSKNILAPHPHDQVDGSSHDKF